MNAKTTSRAVLYHYFEANQTYRDNLVFFLECGWLDDVDYYLICSSPCSVDLPRRPNLHVIEAPNLNLDYGGYCHAVDQHGETLAQYDTLAFVNCSVRGPFMPCYFAKSWYEIFSEMLEDEVHLVGSSHNFLPNEDYYSDKFCKPGPFPHLQTTAYAMTGVAFAALKAAGFYDQFSEQSKLDVIADYEIGMTDFILEKEWKVKSILPSPALEDPDEARSLSNFSAENGDALFRGAYFGRTVSPEEVVFIKTNRDLFSERRLASLTYSHLAQRPRKMAPKWQDAQDLHVRSYHQAKDLHEAMIARKSGFRNRLRRKLIQWLDRYL